MAKSTKKTAKNTTKSPSNPSLKLKKRVNELLELHKLQGILLKSLHKEI